MIKMQTWAVLGGLLFSLVSAKTLQAPLQDLGASVTPQGLQIQSTSEEEGKSSFRLTPRALGRGAHPQTIGNGQVSQEGEYLMLNRGILTERVSANMDGVRQDFIIASRPQGLGPLNLVLEVMGAEVQARQDGTVGLILEGGRELRYHRLLVTDAQGASFPARMVAMQNHSIHIEVQDSGAKYPLTIDPTVADADWLSMNPGIPGTNGIVNRVHFDESKGILYVAGSFKAAGGVVSSGLAQWDGNNWKDLDVEEVSSMITDGKGNLYAILKGRYVSMWDGTKWSSLGGEFRNKSLERLALDVSGNLYASATSGSGAEVEKWDGNAWVTISIPSYGNQDIDLVHDIICDKSGNLYVSGEFFPTEAPADANTLAKWNGASWSFMGQKANAEVHELGMDKNGVLYATGIFQTSEPSELTNIAKWNGSQWIALTPGRTMNTSVMTVTPNGEIYVVGSTKEIDGVYYKSIDKWNGNTWSELPGSIVDPTINSIAIDGQGGFFVGGYFNIAGGVVASNIAHWKEGKYVALGTGIDGPIADIISDGKGGLYMAGSFRQVGSVPANYIAKWNGSTWIALGSGLNAPVAVLALDSKGNLYAGGMFYEAGGVEAQSVAKWDGKVWSSLGKGLNGGVGVTALLIDAEDHVYAGGNFTQTGTTPMKHIAKWDGVKWNSLGTGIGAGQGIRALAQDANNNLYVGGIFTKAGDLPVKNIAAWDGTNWSALGEGFDDGVYTLIFDKKGTLYAGGTFANSGATSTGTLAKWNGATWASPSKNMFMGGYVNEIIMDPQGTLYVSSNQVYRCEGDDYISIGEFSGSVRALAFSSTGDLFAGGGFIEELSPSTVYSPYLMRFGDPATGAVRKLHANPQDLNVKAGRLFVGQYEGSVNIRRLDGSLVKSMQVNRQSSYDLLLGEGAYILEAGDTKLRFNIIR